MMHCDWWSCKQGDCLRGNGGDAGRGAGTAQFCRHKARLPEFPGGHNGKGKRAAYFLALTAQPVRVVFSACVALDQCCVNRVAVYSRRETARTQTGYTHLTHTSIVEQLLPREELEHPHGLLPRRVFCELRANVLYPPSPALQAVFLRRENLRKAFDHFDLQGTGSINKSDLLQVGWWTWRRANDFFAMILIQAGREGSGRIVRNTRGACLRSTTGFIKILHQRHMLCCTGVRRVPFGRAKRRHWRGVEAPSPSTNMPLVVVLDSF